MTLPVFRDPVTGERSFSITAAALTLAVVLIRVCIGGTDIFGHRFDPINDSTITALLTPTLLTYVARKATTAASEVAAIKAAP